MAVKTAQENRQNVLSYQGLAVLLAAVLSYIFGKIANIIWAGDLSGGTIGSVSPGSFFIYIFGFYLGLFFTISFTHFAFIKQPSRYYYVTIGILLFTSLILIELFWLAVGYTAAGMVAGFLASLAIRRFRPPSPAK